MYAAFNAVLAPSSDVMYEDISKKGWAPFPCGVYRTQSGLITADRCVQLARSVSLSNSLRWRERNVLILVLRVDLFKC